MAIKSHCFKGIGSLKFHGGTRTLVPHDDFGRSLLADHLDSGARVVADDGEVDPAVTDPQLTDIEAIDPVGQDHAVEGNAVRPAVDTQAQCGLQ